MIDGMSQSSTFGAGVHPDLPGSFVHFTGRPRAASDVPPQFASATPERRLVQILQQGILRAALAFGTAGPVLCVSESTTSAIRVMLSTGVTSRGPYAPWALLLDRDALIRRDFRPVWHMSGQELQATSELPASYRDRRIRYEPGVVDWLAEREWRACWGDSPIEDGRVPGLELTGVLNGVIVGRRGWMPPPITTFDGPVTWRRYARSCHAVPRLWWNGQELVADGEFNLNRQMAEHDAYYE
jgi:hypothetical protein